MNTVNLKRPGLVLFVLLSMLLPLSISVAAPPAQTGTPSPESTQQAQSDDETISPQIFLVTTADPNRAALIILMSDGHPTVGMNSEQILAIVAPEAAESGVRICTTGFASEEDEVDADLMNTLAEETGGDYTFARTGEELLGFFVECRQGLVSNVVSELHGSAGASTAFVNAGVVEVPPNTAEIKLTLNYLEGDLEIVLVDPDGNEVQVGDPGYSTQKGDNLQLTTVTNPSAGEWQVKVKAGVDAEEDSLFNVLVSMTEQPDPTATPIPPTPSPTPPAGGLFAGIGGTLPLIIGGCVCLGLLIVLGGIGGVLFNRRRRESGGVPQAGSTSEPSSILSAPAPEKDSEPQIEPDEPPIETEAMGGSYDPNATVVSKKTGTNPPAEPDNMTADLNQTIVNKPTDDLTSDLNATLVHRPKKEEETDDDASAV